MNKIIKITDVESGKELEMVKGDCKDCFYCQELNCPEEICGNDIIFKEVINKKQEDESK